MDDKPDQSPPRRVECPAATEPALRLFILAGIFVLFGIWCFLDRDKYKAPPAWTAEHLGQAAGYVLNNFGPFVLVPLGALFAVRGRVVQKRLLLADDDGIGYVGKTKVPWSRVAGLDASKLKAKQVLILRMNSGARMTLDSWKLRNFKDLVALIEHKVVPQAPPGAPALTQNDDSDAAAGDA